VLDSTGDSLVSADSVLRAKALEAASTSVSFGAVPSATGGLVLSQATLANLATVRDLTLRSYGTIDFWGPAGVAGLDLDKLTLDAGALVQRSSGNVGITAKTVSLRNSGGILTAADDVTNAGTLSLSAGTLIFEAGQSATRGFGAVSLVADREIQ